MSPVCGGIAMRVVLTLGLVLLATPAFAQDPAGFKMPSGNVYCQIEPGYDGHPQSDLRCDIMQINGQFPHPPADCDLSWGDAFAISERGRSGIRVCHGDTVRNDELPVLGYGATWNEGGFSCMSSPTGVTCTNSGGHGFSLSRAVQRVF
jgi:hypothetical protein